MKKYILAGTILILCLGGFTYEYNTYGKYCKHSLNLQQGLKKVEESIKELEKEIKQRDNTYYMVSLNGKLLISEKNIIDLETIERLQKHKNNYISDLQMLEQNRKGTLNSFIFSSVYPINN